MLVICPEKREGPRVKLMEVTQREQEAEPQREPADGLLHDSYYQKVSATGAHAVSRGNCGGFVCAIVNAATGPPINLVQTQRSSLYEGTGILPLDLEGRGAEPVVFGRVDANDLDFEWEF